MACTHHGKSGPEEIARFHKALKAAACRMTAPRAALVDIFVGADAPSSVPELHDAVNQRLAAFPGDEPVNLVTVYRFANLLVELGLARKVEFGQGYARYERSEAQDGPHHHHIVCEQCGDVVDFDECAISDLAKRLETSSGFRISRHQLELYGTCPSCQLPAGA